MLEDSLSEPEASWSPEGMAYNRIIGQPAPNTSKFGDNLGEGNLSFNGLREGLHHTSVNAELAAPQICTLRRVNWDFWSNQHGRRKSKSFPADLDSAVMGSHLMNVPVCELPARENRSPHSFVSLRHNSCFLEWLRGFLPWVHWTRRRMIMAQWQMVAA